MTGNFISESMAEGYSQQCVPGHLKRFQCLLVGIRYSGTLILRCSTLAKHKVTFQGCQEITLSKASQSQRKESQTLSFSPRMMVYTKGFGLSFIKISILLCVSGPSILIDWEHMANKKSQVCDNVIEACEAFGLRDIMGFKYNWNVEIIAQFHCSLYYSASNNTIHWTTCGIHFAVDYRTMKLGNDLSIPIILETHDI